MDEHSKSKIRKSLEIPESAFVFGRVGQPIKFKWSKHLISAFNKLIIKQPNAHLLLIGAPKSIVNQSMTVNRRFRRNIKVIPFIKDDDELRKYYNVMDCFVHSAEIGESFGMVLAEAMLCGCPIITVSRPFRDNSQIEIVEPLKGGVSVSNNSILHHAMELMMRNDDLHKRISMTSADSIVQRFDADTVVKKLLKIAQILMKTKERKHIQNNLEAINIQTKVEINEIKSLLDSCIGEDIKHKLYLIKLIHVPLLYRTYLLCKGTLNIIKKQLHA
jgi:glycosyltransferase involved in cell wall biosynthesis